MSLPPLPPMKPLTTSLPSVLPPLKTDLRQHLDTFFPTRNQVKPNPVENVNYDSETLTYMSSFRRSDETTDIIVNKMKQLGKTLPFSITECCAGIGGNTLSFLDDANISSVISYESNDKRREMLKKNIEMYKLQNKSTVKETFTQFDKCSNCVGFIDAPWLQKGIKGTVSTKDQYILSGMKVGNKTLETIIKESPFLDLIAFKVPQGYRLGPIPQFRVDQVPLKNSLILLVYPEVNNKLEKLKNKKQQELEEERIWLESLKNFLRNDLLPRVTTSPGALDKLVSDEAMEIWKVAYTHESFSPTQGENYEELELYGDLVIGTSYVKFIRQMYPHLTRSELSELRTMYLAKKFQSDLSLSLGLGKYVRSRFKKSTHVFEDVLESTFGALDLIGDKIFKFGAGMGLAFNLVVSLYQDVEVDWVITKGNPKTRIKEIFERSGWINPKIKEKVPEEAVEDKMGNTTFTISLNNLAMEQLRNTEIPVVSSVIARTTASTKKKASDEAYKMAVINLENMGITEEWVEEIRGRKDLDNPDLVTYVTAVNDRLKEEGYVRFYLTEHHVKAKGGGKTTGKYVQMIGVDSDGRKTVLNMTKEPVEFVLEAKQKILSEYASYEV